MFETIWVKEKQFRKHVWDAGDRATLENIYGFNRWVITREDGSKYIVRPILNE